MSIKMVGRKEKEGIVVGDKMQKTIVVKTMMITHHRAYGKVVKRYNKFKVHDENNTAKIGDKVRIVETRPLSKDKCWRLAEVIK